MISEKRFLELIRFDTKKDSYPSQYYWRVYKKFSDTFFVKKINWAGFAFGSTLFLYRRMYLVFFLMLFFEQVIETYITTFGFDRGMAHAYGTFVGNVITAVIFNTFYMRFLRRKEKKKDKVGVHLRLFFPLTVFVILMFGGMVFQFIGLHFDIEIINTAYNYILSFGLLLMITLYIFYFMQWRKNIRNLYGAI